MLFTLDQRPLEAALQQAEANLERDIAQAANAKAQAARYQDLAQRGIATRSRSIRSSRNAAALDATVGADRAAVENAQGAAAVRDDHGADLRPHRRAAWCTRATSCAPTTRRRSSSSTRSRRSTSSFAVPEAHAAGLEALHGAGHAPRRRARPPNDAGPAGDRPDHLRRQRGRSDDRHDQGQGHVPERRPPAVAGPVRQRRRDARDRSERDRRAVARRADRPAGHVRLRRQGRSDRGAAAGRRSSGRSGDRNGHHERARRRARRSSPTASCGSSPAAASAIKNGEPTKATS